MMSLSCFGKTPGTCRLMTRLISSKRGEHILKAEITRRKGREVLNDPLFNKGLAFPYTERDRLGLRGLLPPSVRTMQEQEQILTEDLHTSWQDRQVGNVACRW